ncbi:MAG: ABC transporter permease [Actinobacteria bacterium]|nr:ABC transporter permease [Actinomycetota bacterium]
MYWLNAMLRVLVSSLETGLPLVFMFLGVHLIFRVLDSFDMTVDGTFPLGGATVAILLAHGTNPVWATLIAVAAGCLAGVVTGFIHVKLRVSLLLSGIIMMICLYTVNLRIMHGPNVPLLDVPTVFSFADRYSGLTRSAAVIGFLLVLVGGAAGLLVYFLKSQVGLGIRATGGNALMARSLGVNTAGATVLCLVIANGLIAFSGALVAQNQGFADISMGIGSIVAGIASILLGEIIVRRPSRVARAAMAVVVGTLFYRFVIIFALRLGLQPFDLRLFTGLILLVVITMPMGLERVRSFRRGELGNARPGGLAWLRKEKRKQWEIAKEEEGHGVVES